MSKNSVQTAEREAPPAIQVLRSQIEARLDGFAEALPAHITPAHFKSVLLRAAMADPNLLAADRLSFFEAALHAATDGLLPDKREGAMVIYNTKVKEGGRDIWIGKVQWMPMIRGIFTKVYNTGQVKSATVGTVYGGDQFRAWVDDEGEHLFHEEAEEQDRNLVRRFYAQVVMNNGGVFVDTMRMDDVEKIRRSSKSPERGPWADWFDEMAHKTVFRHLSKRLPISREIAAVLDRDNFLYEGLKDVTPAQPQPKRLTDRLDALVSPSLAASSSSAPTPNHGNDGNRSGAGGSGDKPGRKPAEASPASAGNNTEPEDDALSPAERARAQGHDARARSMSRKAIPAEYREDEELLNAWLEGFDG